jgi:hypothetical protein
MKLTETVPVEFFVFELPVAHPLATHVTAFKNVG